MCLPRFALWVMVNGLSTTDIELHRMAECLINSQLLAEAGQLECPLIPHPECPTFADDLHTHMDKTTNLTIISQLPKVKVALEENGHAFRHITFCLCRIRQNGINPKEY